MTASYDVTFAGNRLSLLGTRALWWEAASTLVVSDLHLGKSERIARRSGIPLPPYETSDTLHRLAVLLTELAPRRVICLGDSFDDDQAARSLRESDQMALNDLLRHRDWIWVEGNHDPGPPAFAGQSCTEITLGNLAFRHIANPDAAISETGEISGHYHPKASLRGQSRPAFLLDQSRLIMPAFGTYTGGLRSSDPSLRALFAPQAFAVLTGPRPLPCPLPQ